MHPIDALLAPIPGPAPCGHDLLFSAEYDALQKAREQDDPSLDQGDWVIDLKEADWPFVLSQSEALLRDKSKDLRLAVWHAEALCLLRGFAGLGAGYRLLTGLCERWWDELHPLIEDGDLDVRIGSVRWWALRSVDLVRQAPLVQDGTVRYGLQVWESAVAIDQAVKRGAGDAADLARGKVNTEEFERARRATPVKFFQQTHADVRACEAAVAHFERVFDERTGSTGPSFTPVKEVLLTVRTTLERFARDAGISMDAPPVPPAPGPIASPTARVEPSFDASLGTAHGATAPAAAAPRPGVHSRAQAITQLKEVAAFFEQTEPSSPTAYMAKKAALWADMPLHAWLRHVIKNETELAQLEDLLGIAANGAEQNR